MIGYRPRVGAEPNEAVRQTGHANDGLFELVRRVHVSQLMSAVFGPLEW